jgi:hypothetical protein
MKHMSTKSVLLVSALALLGFAGSASAAVNLVQNGSFELTTPAGSTNFFIGQAGQPQLADWSYGAWPFPNAAVYTYAGANGAGANDAALGASIPLYGPGNGFNNGFVDSPDGGNFLVSDSEAEFSGAITQTISGLTSGHRYVLSFDWAGNQYLDSSTLGYTGPLATSWVVSLGAQTFATPLEFYSGHGFTGWLHQTFIYTATSASEVLSFLAQGGPNGVPPVSLLDGVSLTVPEPASWAMMALGFAGLGFAGYRRAKGNAAAFG